MNRDDGRSGKDLRKVVITKNFTRHAEGSCLVAFGETKVICTASVEEKVPPFLQNSGSGWVTAEYGMLPRSTTTRIHRERALNSGRTQEIQRLIGRSLRSVVDLKRLGERTIKIDCDVIQADGGTRTAAVTGGYVALVLAIKKLMKQGVLETSAVTDYVAAVSVGIYQGKNILDLNYVEDSSADMDMNVVMLGSGNFVEVQGTAEKAAFSKDQLDGLLLLAQKGIKELIDIQKKVLN